MIAPPSLTPEERRTIGIGALTALVTGVVGGLVAWGFEEAKRVVSERRQKKTLDAGLAPDGAR